VLLCGEVTVRSSGPENKGRADPNGIRLGLRSLDTNFLVFDLGDPFRQNSGNTCTRRPRYDYVVLRKPEQKKAESQNFFLLASENFFQSINIPNIAGLSRDNRFRFHPEPGIRNAGSKKITPVRTIQERLEGTKRKRPLASVQEPDASPGVAR